MDAVFLAERHWDPSLRISGSACLDFLQEPLLVCESTSEGQSVKVEAPLADGGKTILQIVLILFHLFSFTE